MNLLSPFTGFRRVAAECGQQLDVTPDAVRAVGELKPGVAFQSGAQYYPRAASISLLLPTIVRRGDQMTKGEVINAIVNGLVALGTLFLAAAAIYGEVIRSWLVGPKLKLVLKDPKGTPFKNVGRRHYFLEVVNSRPKALATNCHVRVKKMWRQIPNGEYVEVALAYPLTLYWPPSEYTPYNLTIRHEERVDFGYVQCGSYFWPNVRAWPIQLDDVVKAEPKMRFGLEIVSDQFVSLALQVFEVSWNGERCDDLEKNGRSHRNS
jgi:hypothetical protein